VNDFCRAVDVLVRHNVTPIIIFDGEELPAKQTKKEDRKRYEMHILICLIDSL